MSVAVQAGLFACGIAVGAFAAVQTGSSKRSNGVPSSISGQASNSSLGALPTTSAALPQLIPRHELLKYGHPGPISDVLTRTAYVAAYDRQKRHPAWTAEHLTAASLRRTPTPTAPLPPSAAGAPDSTYAEALIRQQEERQQVPAVDRANSTFKEDVEVPDKFRAKLQDYFRSGYDRGHMVPAADAKRSQDALDETFLLTNIAPQVGDGFNRHYWAFVEDFCRRLTGHFSDVYVFTVPLYLPRKEIDGKWRVSYEVIGAQTDGTPSVAVPTHFAKVILGARPTSPSTPLVQETSIGAFVLPNAIIPDETPFEAFEVPVDAVERAAGLSLFDDVTKANSKELCRTVKCEVIIRRFDDTQRKVQGGGNRSRRGSASSP